MRKVSLVSFVFVFGLILAACQASPTPTNDISTNNVDQASEASPTAEKTSDLISFDMIAQHSTADDCWMAIDGMVYDVTPFIQSQTHPGGSIILEGCGQDATTIFNNKPGEGEPHSTQAQSLLSQYLIGSLDSNQ